MENLIRTLLDRIEAAKIGVAYKLLFGCGGDEEELGAAGERDVARRRIVLAEEC